MMGEALPRLGTMTRILLDYRKWPDTPHWQLPTTELGRDGAWARAQDESFAEIARNYLPV